jgi:hypothetical protein
MHLSLQQFALMGLSLVAVVPMQTLLIVAEMEEKCAGGHHAQVMEEDLLLLPRLLLPRLHLLLLLLEDVQFVPPLVILAVALALMVESLAAEAVSSNGNADAEFSVASLSGDDLMKTCNR